MGGTAADAAREKIDHLRDDASGLYDQGRAKAEQVEQTFEQYIRERPVKSILIATGIGLLLGRFWMRR